MVLLIGFALVAGAGTALSPCVLPILPAVLSAGVSGARRRPLGVAIGLALSFAFATVALVYAIDALGLPNEIQRTIAVVVLGVFGFSLLFPPVSDRIEAMTSRLIGSPRLRRGEGFGSGLLLGAGLGLVYAPCAGPILAGVITVSATQDFTVGRLAVALAYGIGSGAVLYAAMIGGRRLRERIGETRRWIQPAMGAVMVIVAIVMSANLDIRFQNAIAEDLPDFLTNPTGGLEGSEAVASGIGEVRGGDGHGGATEGGAAELAAGAELPVLAPAPEITDPGEFLNTGGEPISIADRNAAGDIVLVDFWTYTCINCIRTFPYLKAWDERYRDQGLTTIGVHSPEFPFERNIDNVREAVERNGIRYPVVGDNDFGTWNAFANQYWPAKYLIDSEGRIRYAHFGEGGYKETEQAIRALLAESGRSDVGAELAGARTERISPELETPETWLGAERARGFINGRISTGAVDFGEAKPGSLDRLPLNAFAFQGRWRISRDDATARGEAKLDAGFKARRVFLVLGPGKRGGGVEVKLDGKPIRAVDAGDDVAAGRVDVDRQRLYRLVDLDRVGRHRLSLDFDPGVSGYAFTFG